MSADARFRHERLRREEWGKLGDNQKLDYLFNWSERLEGGYIDG